MSSINFDQIVERRGTGSAKWEYYPADVLPMWVADMDFRSPEPVVRALRERAEHGFFGYEFNPRYLLDTVCARLDRLYGWKVAPEEIVLLPSLVTGINVACRAFAGAGDSVLSLTPTYPPFLSAPANHGQVCDMLELPMTVSGRTVSYGFDFDAFAKAFHERTKLFLLCSPQNPTGVAYTRAELTRMAEICIEHGAVICSDEIHCDLLLGGTQHIPLAAVSPEIAQHTVTLMAPSKTFNLPGLKCSMAIVQNPELRKRLNKACEGLITGVNSMGMVAAAAAYGECEDWLIALRAYLTENRDTYVNYVVEQLPQLRTTVPQATYLAWIDCREAGIPGDPYTFFLNEAKVALSSGGGTSTPGFAFGPGGEGFVRLNFATPRAMLLDGLDRMRGALERLGRAGA